MAVSERGLGRGLDSLLRSTRDMEVGQREPNKLALSQLVPGPHQPRKKFDEASLNELATSIKNQGVIQPLLVRPRAGSVPLIYEIIAGERRWRAARQAGLTEVPVIIANYTDEEVMTIALVENLQREDLNPLEEAQAFNRLKDTYQLSQEELAAKLGKSRSTIANALRLLNLFPPVLEGLAEGKLSAGHARTLLAITKEEDQIRLYEAIVAKALSVRDVEAAADSWKRTGVLPAPFLEEAVTPVPRASRAPKPETLKSLQKQLRTKGITGAVIGGTEDKGKISLPYSSREELNTLLELLGVGTSKPVSLMDIALQNDAKFAATGVSLRSLANSK